MDAEGMGRDADWIAADGSAPPALDDGELGVVPEVREDLPTDAGNLSLSFLAGKYEEMAQKVYDNGDVRSRDLLLMGKMDLVLGITAGYLLFVWLGPRIMRQRPACELRRLMLVYNVVMVVWSGWMFAELLINSQLAGYNYFCTPYSVSFAPTELRIVRALWAYYVSKAVEFLDTVFMVLKKKEKQLTFLHVYHHAVMFPLWYFVMMDGPCCQAVFSAMLNSFVHVVMYSYYALALFPALHPYLWWKRYLTQLQLVQFLCVITATLTGLLTGCDYPFWLHVVNIAFLVSLVILFSRFYISAYIRRYRTPPASRPASAKIPLNKPEPPVLHLRPKAE